VNRTILSHPRGGRTIEDRGYIADIPDLEACSAFGATAEEALAEVEKAKEAWLAAAREAGKPIPEPRYRPAIYAR
jgi:predicted RNase H-like HicB family nuclease